MLSAIPKHRGRKSKKELELLSAIQERKRQDELAAQQTQTTQADFVPELPQPEPETIQPEATAENDMNDNDIPEASFAQHEPGQPL